MDIGVGIDGSLGLSLQDQRQASREAARLGYSQRMDSGGARRGLLPSLPAAMGGFHRCCGRRADHRHFRVAGVFTRAGSPGHECGNAEPDYGRAVPAWNRRRRVVPGGDPPRFWCAAEASPVRLMREYLETVRGLLAGEVVTYEGRVVNLRGVQLAFDSPPRTPVYLGALGPQMLRLAGQLADGVALNWCTPEQIAWQ